MTFSLLDEEGRSWHLSSPFSWWVLTPDKSHYASLALPGVAVSGTPEGPMNLPTARPNPDLTIPPTLSSFLELTAPALSTLPPPPPPPSLR